MSEYEKDFAIGEDAKRFMVTDLGKYIDLISQEQIDNAKHEMMTLDPYEYKTLEELQNAVAKIQRQGEIATAVRGYIANAIETGRQAEHLLNEGD